MTTPHLATWISFLVSPAAPRTAMQPLELDGYLTGLIVAPDLIPPSLWISDLWGEDEPAFDSTEQMQAVLSAVMAHYNAIIAEIDKGWPAYRPMFMGEEDKPPHDRVRIWVRGFWKAMTLVPEAWSALAEDERSEILVEPFAAFIELNGPDTPPEPDNIDEIRDDSAALIPRIIPALRALAQMRARENMAQHAAAHTKIGRNDPCPCGSGRKYKRCCLN